MLNIKKAERELEKAEKDAIKSAKEAAKLKLNSYVPPTASQIKDMLAVEKANKELRESSKRIRV